MTNRKITIAAVIGVAFIAWLGFRAISKPHPVRTPVAVTEAQPAVATRPVAPPKMSRREQLARLVAETAAITADRIAREVIAEKNARDLTASR